ncbi:MAG: V-type ATP synthase subunit E [Clostridiales bacterium]|nr:V-type ATP synthase subunit E [Clostridiales bacterium]
MQGKQNIIDDIIKSAKKSAETMIADAEQEKAEVEKAIAAELSAREKSAEEEAKAAADAVKSGKLKLGELEAGKIFLGYKRECVDNVYAAVKAKILKMKDAEYLAMLSRLIKEVAEDGDEIVAAKADSKRVNDAWVKKLSGSIKKKLTLSKEKGDFEAGVILKNAKYDRDLTVDEIIADLKERTEPETVKTLQL